MFASPTPAGPDDPRAILREGETCGRRVRADRLAWLIDGEAFFDAAGRALARAESQILLVGWDFHSQMRLWRGTPPIDGPAEFLDLLDHLVRARRSLHVHALCWDYAAFYTLERELLPSLRFGALSHRRIHFRFDTAHPLLASQHQKLIVVDDSIAFVGGFDITHYRWDARAHTPDDPRRRAPSGEIYRPFHDVEVMVSGPAAAAVGELARERWQRATRRRLRAPEPRPDAWIEGVPEHGRALDVGLARTLPYYEEHPEVREVERLFLESIRRARRWIYIESQYLTAERIADALCHSLRAEQGPEIVIVGPRQASGWLEKSTMDLLRSRVVTRLRAADHAGRLRVDYPDVPGLDSEGLAVHSKVMVVDEVLARVGSANLSNRSMGLDSECDLALDASGHPEWRPAVRTLLHELLAEHLDGRPEQVADEIARRGSLLAAIDAIHASTSSGRRLRPLEIAAPNWSTEILAAGLTVADPETPAPWQTLQALFPIEALESPPYLGVRWWPSFLALAGVGGIAALARLTPLSAWLDPSGLEAWVAPARSSWLGPCLGVGVFFLLSHLMLPVTWLIIASGMVFGGIAGTLVAWLGTALCIVSGHQLGRRWLRESVRKRAGEQVQRVRETVTERGVLSSVVLRMIPWAPFPLVNLIAGASGVRFRDFVLGSLLAMTPGIVLLAWTSHSLLEALREPSATHPVFVVAIALVAGGSMLALRRWAEGEAADDADAT